MGCGWCPYSGGRSRSKINEPTSFKYIIILSLILELLLIALQNIIKNIFIHFLEWI